MPPRKDVVTKSNKKSIGEKAIEYNEVKQEIKTLTARAEKLKKELRTVIDNKGTSTPQGHRICTVKSSQGDLQLTATCRTKTYLKANAIEIITERLPELRKTLIERVEVVREDRLTTLIENGTIPVRVARQIIGTEDNYAFSVKDDSFNEEGV